MKLNPHPELLKVGDKVTTDFNRERTSNKLVRTIVEIIERRCESGRMVMVDPSPDRSENSDGYLDSSWFLPIEEPPQ